MVQLLTQPIAQLQQRPEVHAGVVPHALEHPGQVLGGDVAGGVRRERAPAHAPDGRIEAPHARLLPYPDQFLKFTVEEGNDARIRAIEFFGNTTGDVDVDVHDMLSGELLVTETISATAGQVSGKEVNISIQARRQKMRLFISTDETEFYRANVTDGCSTCFGKVVYKNGILQANTGRILKADAVQYQNLTSYSYTGGLSAIVSVSCDHGAWICEMKSAMALPLIYCLGREILTAALYNFDRWGIKDLRKEDVKERRDELEALYSKSMSGLYEWMPIPQDPSCFVCNSRTSTGVILP